MKRHYRPALTGQTRIDVTAETAGWKYLSFRVVALDQGSSEELSTAGNEVIIVPLDGDLVLIHEGCHPVVKAPGTNAYYLNFLADDVRRISAVNDPEYDWVASNWNGNPISVPIGTK